jgi:hypothetical protein
MVTDAVPAGSGGCGTQPPQDGGKGTQPPYRPPSAVTGGACEALSSRDLRQSPLGLKSLRDHGIVVATRRYSRTPAPPTPGRMTRMQRPRCPARRLAVYPRWDAARARRATPVTSAPYSPSAYVDHDDRSAVGSVCCRIGLLPDRSAAGSVCCRIGPLPDAMDPGIHGARTHLVFRSYAAAACQAARTAVI